MSKNQMILDLQLEIRKLAIELENVERFSDTYWEICDQKERLSEKCLELRRMTPEEIQAENKQTEGNRDRN